ncbi:hypothetical protein ACSQ67_021601 [Phaseolus vulgaris]
MSSIGLVKGRVVLIQNRLVEALTSAKDLISTGIKLIHSSVEYDITKSVSFKLISRTNSQNPTNVAGKVGKGSYLENKASVLRTLGGIKEEFDIYFERDDIDMGIPGAFYVTNRMSDEFFLVSLTLEYPDPTSDHDQNNIHFVCNSWVHNNHKTGRIFFANIPYLPGETPVALQRYREEELKNLRGDGTGKREKWDRIYDYDVYNDLGFLPSDKQEHHPWVSLPS